MAIAADLYKVLFLFHNSIKVRQQRYLTGFIRKRINCFKEQSALINHIITRGIHQIKDNWVVDTMKGEALYSNHYDKVESSVRKRYEKCLLGTRGIH